MPPGSTSRAGVVGVPTGRSPDRSLTYGHASWSGLLGLAALRRRGGREPRTSLRSSRGIAPSSPRCGLRSPGTVSARLGARMRRPRSPVRSRPDPARRAGPRVPGNAVRPFAPSGVRDRARRHGAGRPSARCLQRATHFTGRREVSAPSGVGGSSSQHRLLHGAETLRGSSDVIPTLASAGGPPGLLRRSRWVGTVLQVGKPRRATSVSVRPRTAHDTDSTTEQGLEVAPQDRRIRRGTTRGHRSAVTQARLSGRGTLWRAGHRRGSAEAGSESRRSGRGNPMNPRIGSRLQQAGEP